MHADMPCKALIQHLNINRYGEVYVHAVHSKQRSKESCSTKESQMEIATKFNLHTLLRVFVLTCRQITTLSSTLSITQLQCNSSDDHMSKISSRAACPLPQGPCHTISIAMKLLPSSHHYFMLCSL